MSAGDWVKVHQIYNKNGTMEKFIDYDDGAKLIAAYDKAVEALNEIASWEEGPEVNGTFDRPYDARLARETLRELEEVPAVTNEICLEYAK